MLIVNIAIYCSFVFTSLSMGESVNSLRPVPEYFSNQYFEKVLVTSTNLTIQMKSSGQRYFIRKSDGSLHKCEYGELIHLDIGDSLTIIARDSNLSLSPLPEQIKSSGFMVTEVFNNQSAQYAIVTNRSYMDLQNIVSQKLLQDSGAKFYEATESSISKILESSDK